jgi:hypothetical protein
MYTPTALGLTAALAVAGCGSPSPTDPPPDARVAAPDARAGIADAADVSDAAPDPCAVRTVTGYRELDADYGTPRVDLDRRLRLQRFALDPHGRLVLLLDDGLPDPNGAAVEVTTEALVRLRADGSLDHSFGERGWVDVPPARDADHVHEDRLLAVDAAGRIYLAADLPGTMTRIRRFTVDGAIDRSFGAGGDGGGAVTTSDGHFSGGGAVMIAIGTSIVHAARGVTRLGERGEIVGSMDPDGVRAVAGDEAATYVASDQPALSVHAFTADGRPIPGFGDGGVAVVRPRTLNPGGVRHLLRRRDGGIDVVTEDGSYWLTRLTSRGELDTTYGDAGQVDLGLFPIGLAQRCDGVTVAHGTTWAHRVVATTTLGGDGARSHQAVAMPWATDHYPYFPEHVFDPTTGAIVVVDWSRGADDQGPLVIQTARLMP